MSRALVLRPSSVLKASDYNICAWRDMRYVFSFAKPAARVWMIRLDGREMLVLEHATWCISQQASSMECNEVERVAALNVSKCGGRYRSHLTDSSQLLWKWLCCCERSLTMTAVASQTAQQSSCQWQSTKSCFLTTKLNNIILCSFRRDTKVTVSGARCMLQ